MKKWLLPISLLSLLAMESCRTGERKAGAPAEASESKGKGSKDRETHYEDRPDSHEAPKPGTPGGVEKPKGKD